MVRRPPPLLCSGALLGALLGGLVACVTPTDPAAPAPVGTTRGAVVAIPMTGGAQPLTYLAGRLSPDQQDELRALAPNVHLVAGLSPADALGHAAQADGADAHLLTPELLLSAPDLRWVQAWSAGVERYLGMEGLARSESIVFTNMKGVHGPVIAEHAFGMLLELTRDLRAYAEAQSAARWDPEAARDTTALAGHTMLVVGLGGIGTEIARRAHGFDMRVLATNRDSEARPTFVDYLGRAAELDALLPEADVVAICVPLTDETDGMFDEARIGRMKRGAILVNVARGRIVRTDALLAALEQGRLAGACLDVTDPEPLPSDHPLWKRHDVVITPHVAARAELTEERRWRLFRENFARFAEGRPLLNVVDKAAGY